METEIIRVKYRYFDITIVEQLHRCRSGILCFLNQRALGRHGGVALVWFFRIEAAQIIRSVCYRLFLDTSRVRCRVVGSTLSGRIKGINRLSHRPVFEQSDDA